METIVPNSVDLLLEQSEFYSKIEEEIEEQEERLRARLKQINDLETKAGSLEQKFLSMTDAADLNMTNTAELINKLDRLTKKSTKFVNKVRGAFSAIWIGFSYALSYVALPY